MREDKTYLRSDEGKARRNRGFEHAEEQTDRNSSSVVFDTGKAGQD
jgi:hypothetical protein